MCSNRRWYVCFRSSPLGKTTWRRREAREDQARAKRHVPKGCESLGPDELMRCRRRDRHELKRSRHRPAAMCLGLPDRLC